MTDSKQLTVALAQLAPVWLDREQTLEKILAAVDEAAQENAQLVCFGESLLPGYPFWLERTAISPPCCSTSIRHAFRMERALLRKKPVGRTASSSSAASAAAKARASG